MSDSTVSRRKFVQGSVSGLILAAGVGSALAEEPSPHPSPDTFQSGDFLWPARPGTFIPRFTVRSLTPQGDAEADPERALWEEEKRRFIEKARQSADPAAHLAADRMEALSYEAFRSQFFDSPAESRTRSFSPFAAGLPQVGHVALLEIDGDGTPWVVEAMPKAQTRYEALYSRFSNGVIRTRYSGWIVQHKDYKVWHGRLKNVSPAQQKRIVAEAKRFLGKDYWFWSLDLSNEAAFYCSKLVWLSVWKATGLALDDDTLLARSFWVTPKALITSDHMELLHSPGKYGG